MKKFIGIVLVLVLLAVSLPGVVSADGGDVLLCRVDIGDEASESAHDASGWGPLEPDTNPWLDYGAPWSGLAEGEKARVIWGWWAYDDGPCATLTLDRHIADGTARMLRFKHLDGIYLNGISYGEQWSDDSFEVKVKDAGEPDSEYELVYSYTATGHADHTSTWMVTDVYLPETLNLNLDGNIVVQFCATNLAGWAYFGSDLGQVAFDWIELWGEEESPPVECCPCKGGVTELTLQYNGADPASVIVYEGKDPKPEKVLFSGAVAPGEGFTFNGIRSDLTMGTEISLWVDGGLQTKIHTSCSQPIGPGLVSGDFEVIAGKSKDNGLLCPLEPCSPDPAPQLEFHDREVRWDITNAGDVGLEISSISISWPTENGYLDEIKKDGDVIHKGDFAATSAVIDAGWEGDANKRTIKPGEKKTLKFKFENNVSSGPYFILVEFAGGCSVEIEAVPSTESEEGCLECKGGVTELTLQYNGADPASVVVYEGKDPKPEKVLFEGIVSPDDNFSFSGVHADGTMGKEISLWVDGELQTKIHTSCSQPIGPGLLSGDFEVIEGKSKDGGPLCIIPQ